MVIYEVTRVTPGCLTYLENIKAVIPPARASALVVPVPAEVLENVSERYVAEVITKIMELYKEVEALSTTDEYLSLSCKNVTKCVQLFWRLGPLNRLFPNGDTGWLEKYKRNTNASLLGKIGKDVRTLLDAAVADKGLANALLQSKIAALRSFVETGWRAVESASAERAASLDQQKTLQEGADLDALQSVLSKYSK
jgi:hypothetical protein